MTSDDTPNPSGPEDWTAERIREATPFPKPRGAIDRLINWPTMSHREEVAIAFVRRMLGDADLLEVTTTNDIGHVTHWLLVPVGVAELEWLCQVGADTEDIEDDEREREDDDEPSLGSSNDRVESLDQTHWMDGVWDDECEGDDADAEDDGVNEQSRQRLTLNTAKPAMPPLFAEEDDAAARPAKAEKLTHPVLGKFTRLK